MSPETPETLGEATLAAQRALLAAGVEDAGRDARLILAAAAGVATADIIARPERRLSDVERGRCKRLGNVGERPQIS